SALRPAVEPSVESDAGEPASPKAAAVPIKAALASGDIPVSIKTGAYNAAKIGIVPNDVPIPIVINNPTLSRTIAINQGESPVMATVVSTTSLIAPVSVRTLAYAEAINMTKAIIPNIPIPSWTTFSPSLISTTRPRNMTIIPLIAPTTRESKYS